MAEPMDVDDEVGEHEFILNHVLLPRYLPPETFNQNKHLNLMELLINNAVETLDITGIAPKTTKLLRHVKRVHIDSSSDSLKQILSEEINALVNGDNETLALFMHHQNCTILFQKQERKFIVATFCSDIEPKNSYDIDIEVIFNSFQNRRRVSITAVLSA